MSGAIGRQYLLQTWNGASEYSGEMIGNRLKSSTQMYLPNGKANIEAFKEDTSKKGGKNSENLEYKLFPQQKTLDNIEKLELELFRKFDQGVIGSEEFDEANHALQIKKQRAWNSLCKAKGWYDEIDELSPEEKAIEKEKERIGRAYYKELQAHNKAIEKELRQAYRVGNKNAVKRITGRSSWWEKLHGIKIVVIVWIIIAILAKMGGG